MEVPLTTRRDRGSGEGTVTGPPALQRYVQRHPSRNALHSFLGGREANTCFGWRRLRGAALYCCWVIRLQRWLLTVCARVLTEEFPVPSHI